MADNLIFPVKFDLEAAVREAQGDADRLLRRLQTTINAKPLAVNLKIPGAGSGSINEINSRLKELVKQWNNLTEAQRITNKTTGEYTAEAKKILAEYTRLRGASESYAQSLKQIDSAAKKAAKQQEKLAEAAYRGSNAFKNQDGYVSRLVKRLAVYASFQYTSQFLTNIREVTAQFELQRISLGAIIQDQQKANQIFAEIKSFALTSPLKILDLTKYAKQVAAYGFAADRVFDVTKRLADISVGLGVDMGRLTLAVSQIKAATVLKSSELRQLTETGLPMLDLLSKKLTETQGKLVSAADVMDLISKRAISYEMVEEILYDLTDAGGMFYNMQVKQSQTLFGMWSKLGDAAAIMYDQIGNTSSINAGMKFAIRSIESMMRNWKTTARVLDSVAVAMTVYIVGLKNAAVASKALTSAVALENLAHQQQIIRTPKIVAGIIGINNAKKISTLLTNLHTKAVLSEAAATNVLTKGFWKLTAAMLANPWVAAASAIALVGVALFHFIGNTETAAERAEKLNNSVASLKNLEDTTKPLIDTYNELINKTERTAEEQKKLSEVTHELAKQYPGAITAIGNFGEEVELAADKLNQLYQAEKQARMENTRHELQETEKQIASTEAKIAQLQKYLSEGKMWSGSGGTGGGGGAMVAMSDEEKGRILAQIDELRYGTDGQSGLFGLQQSAEAARRALGLIPSEAAQAVEKFGAWKKKLTEFNKEVGGVKVRLFDDSTINQFGTLEEALDAAAKKYKEAAESVEKYNKTLESKLLTKDQIDKIAAERDEAQAMKELSEEALNYYNAMALLLKVMGGGRGDQSDPRLSILREMASTLKQVNKEYDELAKKEGASKALADTHDKYANTFKYLQSLATKYKFELPDFGVPTDAASLTKYLDAVKEAMKKLPKSEKAVLSLETDIADIKMADAQKQIEAQLKELAEKISRTKTAKEFYEKILGMTGDVELAANVSLQIYGSTGKELSEQIEEQFRLAFATLDKPDVEVSAKIGDLIDKGRYEELRDYIALLPEAQRKAAEDLVKAQQQMSVKQYEQWLKDLEKAKDYADKRIELSRYTANQIAEIEERIAKLDPAASDYEQQKAMLEKLIAGYKSREDKMGSELEYEQFKNSALYVQVFENLDNASKTALENMRNRLLALKDQWKNLSPEKVKELTKRLEELDAQIAQRNPFKSMAGSIKKLRELRMSGRTKEGDAQKAFDAEADRQAAEAKMLADEKAYEAAVKQYGAESDIAKAKRKIADDSAEAYRRAEQAADSAAENADEWEKVAEAINAANQKLDKYQSQVNEALDGVRKIMESFGASAEDMQFFDDVTNGFNEIFDAGQQGAEAYASFMMGDFVGAATKGISAVGSLISGVTNLFSAGKIKRANKEIKRQQELLDQLEYTHGRLEKAAEKVFGADYISNYNAQMRNLQAQAAAYRKQAEAEQSKGKDADEEKIQQFENSYRDTMDKIADMQSHLAEQMTGTDVASAARDFAKAWLEAYATFGNTTDAIKEKFNDMIKNMIVESVMAKTVQMALQPMFDEMNKMYKSGASMTDVLTYAFSQAGTLTQQINDGLMVNAKHLEAMGVNIRELYSTSDNLTGISKNIASATSEEINAAAAIGNTLMYYVSPIPRMDENLARVVAIMEGRGATAIPQITSTGWTDWQQQAMDNYNAIARNTADTVVECRRAAEACERIASTFKAKGSIKGLNVFLNS